ncbi:unnamed protein product [Rotaria magnacalcarata]|uniref:Uncharacterized protein n=1 Tax=Rotaria magnacalcarata TaxID=392030 RepID=A0A816MR06_9BILA|nr:unnamed protein product [Rotaria magnacalcarata]
MGLITLLGMSAYCASKHALEAFSDCLRREMLPWGLKVSIIEPGWLRTPIIKNQDRYILDRWNELSSDVRNRWGDDFVNDLVDKSIKKSSFINNAENPIKVIRALRHAVMNSKPRIRYLSDWQAKLFFYPVSMLPSWLFDIIIMKLASPSIVPAGIKNQIQD